MLRIVSRVHTLLDIIGQGILNAVLPHIIIAALS